MSYDPNPQTQIVARDMWNQARRKAFWSRLSGALGLSGMPVNLLSFEEVQRKLRLTQNAYRGLQQVPLDKIVGSVGRYHDFTRTFLPLVESDSIRWQRVAELQMESGLPPIELYKVGDAYFVKDGNHRVSVARHFGAKSIEAYVWEYETKVGGVPTHADVDDLIVKAEYRAFLDRTRLDLRRPEQQIVLTEPGMYPALEEEIELYRVNLERIDSEPHTFEQAALAWYDMVYTLAVELIRESDVLAQFPGRTEADLYVWVSAHRRELAERYGTQVSLRDAVADIASGQQKPGLVSRVWQSAVRLVQGLTGERDETQEIILPPAEDEPLGLVLAQFLASPAEMTYQGQHGDAWRTWRSALRGKIWELLALRYTPAEYVPAQEVERAVISGVERVRVEFEAADGLIIPAYCMAPVDQREPLPVLLVFPGHGTIQQTAGMLDSPHKSNALALAQEGFVTFTFEERGFGELGQADHVQLDSLARLLGRSWLSMVLEDSFRALDYLQKRADVAPDRIGATGYGLGGGLALYLAALDERVRAAVIENYVGGGIDPLGTGSHSCDYIPGLRRYAELSDVARLVVPRPALYVYPRGVHSTALARAWFHGVRPTYEAFACPDRTNFIEHGDGNRFKRLLARTWFERWLKEELDTSVLLWAPRE